jgi:hypothetical protein
MEGNITTVMEPGFNLPVAAFEDRELCCIRFRSGQAAQPILSGVFDSYDLSFAQEGKGTFQTKDLAGMGPIEFLAANTTSSKRTILDPSVAFITSICCLEVPTNPELWLS